MVRRQRAVDVADVDFVFPGLVALAVVAADVFTLQRGAEFWLRASAHRRTGLMLSCSCWTGTLRMLTLPGPAPCSAPSAPPGCTRGVVGTWRAYPPGCCRRWHWALRTTARCRRWSWAPTAGERVAGVVLVCFRFGMAQLGAQIQRRSRAQRQPEFRPAAVDARPGLVLLSDAGVSQLPPAMPLTTLPAYGVDGIKASFWRELLAENTPVDARSPPLRKAAELGLDVEEIVVGVRSKRACGNRAMPLAAGRKHRLSTVIVRRCCGTARPRPAR